MDIEFHLQGDEVIVSKNGEFSHEFKFGALIDNLNEAQGQIEFETPSKYGQVLFDALFKYDSLARKALEGKHDRIVLITPDKLLQNIPWEYSHNGNTYLIEECHLIRGLPMEHCNDAPDLKEAAHIIAIPANPLDQRILPLNIEAEWDNLKNVVNSLSQNIILDRSRPSTLERLRELIVNEHNVILHFMGHGDIISDDAKLGFEGKDGGLELVTAKDLIGRIRGKTFLVVLNACNTGLSGPTKLSNIAADLVTEGIPYVLAMSRPIFDEDAITMSRVLYSELVRGAPVEDAVQQAQLTLLKSPSKWAFGALLLYSSLLTPARGYPKKDGTPIIRDAQPPMEISVLTRVEGAFQGRIEVLKTLGKELTSEKCPKVITIHGSGGQGKTALAREAIERFAYAWPGGVWALSLENMPSRSQANSSLARFLSIDVEKITNDITRQSQLDRKTNNISRLARAIEGETERQILARLEIKRTLIVIDNAETLIEKVNKKNLSALKFEGYIRKIISGQHTRLLVTSQHLLDWFDEQILELDGLDLEAGARLFRQSAPKRLDARGPLAKRLSDKVNGHPLCLRLLGGSFNESESSLESFIENYEKALVEAKDKYSKIDHRHRTLYASLDTSVGYLDKETRSLLKNLLIFEQPFLPHIAALVFNFSFDLNDQDKVKEALFDDAIYTKLKMLWHRGLLTLEYSNINNEPILLYQMLPNVRAYVKKYLKNTYGSKKVLFRLGQAYAIFINILVRSIQSSAATVYIAKRSFNDMVQSLTYIDFSLRGKPLLDLAVIARQLGNNTAALEFAEQALDVAQQASDKSLEVNAISTIVALLRTQDPQRVFEFIEAQYLNQEADSFDESEIYKVSSIASVLTEIGESNEAIMLLDKILPFVQNLENSSIAAQVFQIYAISCRHLGNLDLAFEYIEKSYSIIQDAEDINIKSSIMSEKGNIYHEKGETKNAMDAYSLALEMHRSTGDLEGQMIGINNISIIKLDMGKAEEVIGEMEQALITIARIGNRSEEANFLSNLASAYHHVGQLNDALDRYQQSLSISQEMGNVLKESNILSQIATVYHDQNNTPQALICLRESISLARRIGARRVEISALNSLGSIYKELEQPQDAIKQFEQALLIAKDIGARGIQAVILTNLAQIENSDFDYAKRRDLYLEAIKIAQEIDNSRVVATIISNMAFFHENAGELSAALDCHQQALGVIKELEVPREENATLYKISVISKEIGTLEVTQSSSEQLLINIRNDKLNVPDYITEEHILYQLATVSASMGHLEQSLGYYLQSWNILKTNSEEIHDQAIVLHHMGSICSQLGRANDAIKYFDQALPLVRSQQDRESEVSILNSMALAYEVMLQPEKSISIYENIIKHFTSVHSQDVKAKILDNLGRIMFDLKKEEQALLYLQQALSILEIAEPHAEDQISKEEIIQHIEQMGQKKAPQYPDHLSEEKIRTIIQSIGACLTDSHERKIEWKKNISNALIRMDSDIQPNTREFLYATLTILEENIPSISSSSPYYEVVKKILSDTAEFWLMKDPEKALTLSKIELEVCTNTGDDNGRASALNIAAIAYLSLNDLTKCIEVSQEALAILNKTENKNVWVEISTKMNIAVVHRRMGQLENALNIYEDIYPITDALEDFALLTPVLINMAVVYDEIGNKERALSLYKEALNITRKNADKRQEAIILNNMSRIYRKNNHAEKAFEFLNRSLNIRRMLGDQMGEMKSLHNLGVAYEETGNLEESRKYHLWALNLSRKLNNPSAVSSSLIELAGVTSRLFPLSLDPVEFVREAITQLMDHGLSQDDTGHTVNQLQEQEGMLKILINARIYNEAIIPEQELSFIAKQSIEALMGSPDKRIEWRNEIEVRLRNVKTINIPQDIEFYSAVRNLIDEQDPGLSINNPYKRVIEVISRRNVLEGEIFTISGRLKLADRHLSSDNWLKAHEIYETILNDLRIGENRRTESIVLSRLATIAMNTGDLDAASEFTLQASEKVIVDRSNEEDIITLQSNLATLFGMKGELEKAEHLYRESIKKAEGIGETRQIAIQKGNLAEILVRQNKLDLAEILFRESIQELDAINEKIYLALTKLNFADLLANQGQWEVAEPLFRQALEVLTISGALAHATIAAHKLASQLYSRNQFPQAIDLMEWVVMIDKQIDHPDLVKDQARLQRMKTESGHRTTEHFRGIDNFTISNIINKTAAVLQGSPNKLDKWKSEIANLITERQGAADEDGDAFLHAISMLLDLGINAIDNITISVPLAYLDPWNALTNSLQGNTELFEQIAQNTVQIILVYTEKKQAWLEQVIMILEQAKESEDIEMIGLMSGIYEILLNGQLPISPPRLSGKYAKCWQDIVSGLKDTNLKG